MTFPILVRLKVGIEIYGSGGRYFAENSLELYYKVKQMFGNDFGYMRQNRKLPGFSGRVLILALLILALCSSESLAQGSIFGSVTNSDETVPANGEINFFGYLDNTDEEIRIDISIGAGYDNGNWFDDFQNYLTEAAGNPYDYHFFNNVNGEGFVLSDLIPNNSFQQADIILAPVVWPEKPEIITGGSISNDAVMIQWVAVGGLSYHIYRREASSNGSFFRIDDPTGSLDNPGIDGSEYIDNTLNLNDVVQYLIFAEDAAGNLSPYSDIFTVSHTGAEAPIITCPDDIAVSCENPTDPTATGFATATDESDPDPVISYSDEIVPGSCDHAYTINRTWRADDTDGNFSVCLQTITINDNTAPVISCPENIAVDCSGTTDPAVTGTATAEDNCDDSPQIAYVDSIEDNIITRTWTAADACGNVSSCDQIITLEDSTPPQITECPADIVLSCDADTSTANTGVPLFTDDCGTNLTVTWANEITPGSCPQNIVIARTFTVTDESGNSSTCVQEIELVDNTAPELTCPADISVPFGGSTDPSETGTASATDNCSAIIDISYSDNTVGNIITRSWTAIDECGNSISCDQVITIQGSGDPVVNCPEDISIDCSASIDPINTGTPTVDDDNDPDPTITYEDEIIPGACENDYTINRTWTAEDVDGNTGSCIQVISISDEVAPVISCPDDLVIDCAASIDPSQTGTATAEDNCGGSPEIDYVDAIEDNTITRTWTAVDACGNTSSCDQVITIEDTTPPTITECPADLVLACDADTSVTATGVPSFVDDCDTSPVLNWTDEIAAGACPQNIIITRTFIVADNSGNSDSCVQVIEMNDNTGPIITCPDNLTIAFGGSIEPSITGTAVAEDNCDNAPEINYGDVQVGNTIERTWSAVDQCGNSSSCIQILTLSQYAGPVWYVSIDGENTNDGDINAPFGTIQFAIDIASPSDTVMILPGVYGGSGNHDLNTNGNEVVVISADGPASTVIQCEGQFSTPCRGFIFTSGEGPGTILDGLTIRDGYAVDFGGGILCDSSSPTIRNCILEGNTAGEAGAGITCRDGASPVIENTEFRNNEALRYGGAVYCLNNSSAVITNCLFEDNTGDRYGGAIFSVLSSPEIENSIFVGNFARFNGGAVGVQRYSPVTIANCTFYGNSCESQTGGIIFNDGDSLNIVNSIIAFNTNGLAVSCLGAAARINVECSDIYGNDDGDWFGCIGGLNGINGNFSSDPQLCDPAAGNFRLSELSPCAPANNACGVLIGAGGTGCIPTGIEDGDDSHLPDEFSLNQNYPNPFNPSTNISFTVPVRSSVEIEIYNISGQKVLTLFEGSIPAGQHQITWNGTDARGRIVPTGVYLYRLKAGGFVSSRKMLLLK